MESAAYTEDGCLKRRAEALAPRTLDVRAELTAELAEYLAITPGEVERSLENAGERFSEEWRQRVSDPQDERAVIRFYDESRTEIFELAAWHGSDVIHCRSVICADVAASSGVRTILDYGSGIGSDALVLAGAGFDVTIADVSSRLLAFAEWRCRRHGYNVRTVDLKTQELPAHAFDAAICFDVLEHIRRPARALRQVHAALRGAALLFVHAPFGSDPDRPMHLVHADPITRKMRAIGFSEREDLQGVFPHWIWAPHVYERLQVNALDRLGYYIHDAWMPGPAARHLARMYRRVFRNTARRRAPDVPRSAY